MSKKATTEDRVAIIRALTERWPSGEFGRTKLVKCAYFLQAVRGVPLGYNFRLYSYGPYDSTVLDDLDYAKALGQVDVKTVHYSGGYRFDITKTSRDAITRFVHQYSADIDWVVREFGQFTPAQMELAATAIYADRETPNQRIDTLVRQVHEVKPHFSTVFVTEHVTKLYSKGLLSISNPS